MKTVYHLDTEDIRRIISEHFGLSKESVNIIIFKDTIGYGTGETDQPSVRIEVTTETR